MNALVSKLLNEDKNKVLSAVPLRIPQSLWRPSLESLFPELFPGLELWESPSLTKVLEVMGVKWNYAVRRGPNEYDDGSNGNRTSSPKTLEEIASEADATVVYDYISENPKHEYLLASPELISRVKSTINSIKAKAEEIKTGRSDATKKEFAAYKGRKVTRAHGVGAGSVSIVGNGVRLIYNKGTFQFKLDKSVTHEKAERILAAIEAELGS